MQTHLVLIYSVIAEQYSSGKTFCFKSQSQNDLKVSVRLLGVGCIFVALFFVCMCVK